VLRFVPVILVNQYLSGGVIMAIIATISAVGTAIAALIFSLWMVKQLFVSH